MHTLHCHVWDDWFWRLLSDQEEWPPASPEAAETRSVDVWVGQGGLELPAGVGSVSNAGADTLTGSTWPTPENFPSKLSVSDIQPFRQIVPYRHKVV